MPLHDRVHVFGSLLAIPGLFCSVCLLPPPASMVRLHVNTSSVQKGPLGALHNEGIPPFLEVEGFPRAKSFKMQGLCAFPLFQAAHTATSFEHAVYGFFSFRACTGHTLCVVAVLLRGISGTKCNGIVHLRTRTVAAGCRNPRLSAPQRRGKQPLLWPIAKLCRHVVCSRCL